MIAFPVPPVEKIMRLHCILLTADGGNKLFNLLKHDQVSHVVENLVQGRYFPSNVIEAIGSLIEKREVVGDPKAQKS